MVDLMMVGAGVVDLDTLGMASGIEIFIDFLVELRSVKGDSICWRFFCYILKRDEILGLRENANG